MLLLFWAAWLALVAFTNLMGFGQVVGWVGPGFRLASYNFGLITEMLVKSGFRAGLAVPVFLVVVVWQWAGVQAFCRAFRLYRPGEPAPVYSAFGITLALWMGFLLAEEFLLHYQFVQLHMGILTALLASLLAAVLLPDA